MLNKTDIEKAVTKRFPEPLALIICQDKNGKIDFCPVGFFSLSAWEPKIWNVAIYYSHYSAKIISETKEFVLCLPSIDQVKDVLYCGSISGRKVDKTKNVAFKYKKSQYVKPPLIKDSIACYECKVIKVEKEADHIVFQGEIVAAYESGKNWQEKIYNWNDKFLGTMQYGNKSIKINYSPEGLT